MAGMTTRGGAAAAGIVARVLEKINFYALTNVVVVVVGTSEDVMMIRENPIVAVKFVRT